MKNEAQGVSQTDEDATQSPRRKRNAAMTRQAILDSARIAFTRFGYDGVGVREIAQDAGVTAMLVNRYFGSKEKLFEEVIELSLSAPSVLRAELMVAGQQADETGKNIAEKLIASSNPGLNPDGILILLRSAGSSQAAAILRKHAMCNLETMIEYLPGENPEVRAALSIALIAGFKLMRQIIAVPPLNNKDQSDLLQQLARLFAVLVSDPDTTKAPSRG
jgi:Transcriptional regulator